MPLTPDQVTIPGPYYYTPAIEGAEPCRVDVRDVGECGLAIFFRGRDDYDLLSEVSGTFEPISRS